MNRALWLNGSQLTSYDTIKEIISQRMERDPTDWSVQFPTVLLTSVVATTFALPGDNMRTKMLKQTRDANGKWMYDNLLRCYIVTF